MFGFSVSVSIFQCKKTREGNLSVWKLLTYVENQRWHFCAGHRTAVNATVVWQGIPYMGSPRPIIIPKNRVSEGFVQMCIYNNSSVFLYCSRIRAWWAFLCMHTSSSWCSRWYTAARSLNHCFFFFTATSVCAEHTTWSCFAWCWLCCTLAALFSNTLKMAAIH